MALVNTLLSNGNNKFSTQFTKYLGHVRASLRHIVRKKSSQYVLKCADYFLQKTLQNSPSPSNQRSVKSTGAFLSNIRLQVVATSFKDYSLGNDYAKSVTIHPFKVNGNQVRRSRLYDSGLNGGSHFLANNFIRSFKIISDVKSPTGYGYWKNVHQIGWQRSVKQMPTFLDNNIRTITQHIQPYSPFSIALQAMRAKYSSVFKVEVDSDS